MYVSHFTYIVRRSWNRIIWYTFFLNSFQRIMNACNEWITNNFEKEWQWERNVKRTRVKIHKVENGMILPFCCYVTIFTINTNYAKSEYQFGFLVTSTPNKNIFTKLNEFIRKLHKFIHIAWMFSNTSQFYAKYTNWIEFVIWLWIVYMF